MIPWVLVLSLCLLVGRTDAGIVARVTIDDCAPTQYYDTSALECKDCVTVQNSLPTGYVVNAARDGCTCALGLIKTINLDGQFTCTACPITGEVADQTQSVCMPCAPSSALNCTDYFPSVYDSASGQCVCSDGERLVERDLAGNYLGYRMCVPCPSNSYLVDGDPYTCVECPDSRMVVSSGTCVCPSTGSVAYFITYDNQHCLILSQLQAIEARMGSQDYSVEYLAVQDETGSVTASADSYIMRATLVRLGIECAYDEIIKSCQALANLCVLQLYDTDTPACTLFNSIRSTRLSSVHGESEWSEGMPWLYYDSATAALADKTAVSSKLSFNDAPGFISSFEFVFAAFSMDGSFLGFESLNAQFQFCLENPEAMKSFTSVGRNYATSCRLPLADLLDRGEPVMYDVYFVDGELMAPVPIDLVNYEETTGEKILVRRAFLYDNVSGKESSDGTPLVLRVASDVVFNVQLQPNDRSRGPGYIFAPTLAIRYKEYLVASLEAEPTSAAANPTVTFESVYTMDLTEFWRTVTGLFIALIIVLVIVFVSRVAIITRSSRLEDAGNQALMVVFETCAQGLFWFVWILSFYFTFTFKLQGVVVLLLPTAADNSKFNGVLIAAMVCQVLYVILLVRVQSKATIFLIDWEESKGMTLPTSGNFSEAKEAKVSIWRMFFVANEWNELQITRKVNLSLTLFIILTVLRGIGIEFWAKAEPITSRDEGPVNIILRFGINTLVWFIVVFCQLFVGWFERRYSKNSIVEFSDLLSIANISCFILGDLNQGTYIHGKCVFPNADCDMEELSRNLAQDNGSVPRGLNGTADQVFEIFVTAPFKTKLQSCYNIDRPATTRTGVAGNSLVAADRAEGGGPTSKEGKTYFALRTFLSDFIENNLDSHKWVMGRREGWRAYFNIPPETANVGEDGSAKSVFVPVGEDGLSKNIFYGQEFQLILFDILVYSVCDLWFGSTFVSVMVTYVADSILSYARVTLGEAQLVKTAVVDKRFLC